MKIEHITNAWRDEEYLQNLDDATLSHLPESPVGEIDLSDVDLEDVNGGTTWSCATLSLVSATITAASAAICQSYIGHGTCQQGTSGCC